MTAPSATTHRVPRHLLVVLRRSPTTGVDPATVTPGLRALSGGRNNSVWAYDEGGGPICVKLYQVDERRRAEREWHALTLLADHDISWSPTPLWIDHHPHQPAIGMTLLPGTPLPEASDPPHALRALAATTRSLQTLPLDGPPAAWERIDSCRHYLTRLTGVWPAQLAEQHDDPLTPTMRALLEHWTAGGDAELLAAPTPRVWSRGDANLLNWLIDDTATTRCVDFEYTGWSDVAFDAADLVEHISARDIPDQTWSELEPDLGVDHRNRARYQAARRTCALRWLAVLWRRRHQRSAEFDRQLKRTQDQLR